jgi:hypothetical protein
MGFNSGLKGLMYQTCVVEVKFTLEQTAKAWGQGVEI